MISQLSLATPATIAVLAVLLLLSDHHAYAKAAAAAAIEPRGEIWDNDLDGVPPCTPATDGEVYIQHGTGVYLQSSIDQLAGDTAPYPGNTTSGVGAILAQVPPSGSGSTSHAAASKWSLTPLTASIDFKSAFAIWQIPNLAAASTNRQSTPYCLTQPTPGQASSISASAAASSSSAFTAAENGTIPLAPLELQPCPNVNSTSISTGPEVTSNSQLFYLNCQKCGDGGLRNEDCSFESYLWKNECLTVISDEGGEGGQFLILQECAAASANDSPQTFSVSSATRGMMSTSAQTFMEAVNEGRQ